MFCVIIHAMISRRRRFLLGLCQYHDTKCVNGIDYTVLLDMVCVMVRATNGHKLLHYSTAQCLAVCYACDYNEKRTKKGLRVRI